MHDRDSYWEEKLARSPFSQKRFTSEMMTNVEQRLQRSTYSHKGGQIMRNLAIVLALGMMLLVPGFLTTLEVGHPAPPPIKGIAPPIEDKLQSGEGGDVSAWEQMDVDTYRTNDRTIIQFTIALIQKQLGAMGGPSVSADQLWEDPESKRVLAIYEISSPWVSEVHVDEIREDADVTSYSLLLTLTDSTRSEYQEVIQVDVANHSHLIRSVIIETEEDTDQTVGDETAILLAENAEHRAALYSTGLRDADLFKGIDVRYGDRWNRYDDWATATNETYYPTLWIDDVTGDGEAEIIVMLVTGYGTGAKATELKVLDGNLTEIAAADPVQAAASLLEAELEVEEDTRTYVFRLGDDERAFSYNEGDAGVWFDTPAYGNVVDYRVEKGQIYADVSVQVAPGYFPLTVSVRYAFENGAFTVTEAVLTDGE